MLYVLLFGFFLGICFGHVLTRDKYNEEVAPPSEVIDPVRDYDDW